MAKVVKKVAETDPHVDVGLLRPGTPNKFKMLKSLKKK